MSSPQYNPSCGQKQNRGNKHNIYESFVQLILTIGRARTFEDFIPPLFLGAFDKEKIAFIRYEAVSYIFSKNDFNWNVTPSNHESKEFKELYGLVKDLLEKGTLIFYYEKDNSSLDEFIKNNFKIGSNKTQKILITKNNFTSIYYKWVKAVRPSIQVPTSWEALQKKPYNILDADFFLADLLSDRNVSLKGDLYVVLKQNHYEFAKRIDELGFHSQSNAWFNDQQRVHNRFWGIYERPPKKKYQDFIVKRRDLLVPQNVRERKGSYFTPQCWVELSQKYLTDVLGEDWQDTYYIWDCCAGTGNMERGLLDKYKIFASTIDQADVDVIKDQIKNGMNLLESHVFQFDFLNDSFDDPKVPKELQKILKDPEERKNLVIYINPPYAEATSSTSISSNSSRHKSSVANTKTKNKYGSLLGQGAKELFVQFLFRIYKEINGAYIANFSKIKPLLSDHSKEFRSVFTPKLESLFLAPSYTFDNVKGKFPIGFFVWNTKIKEVFNEVEADVYNDKSDLVGNKTIEVFNGKTIKDWLRIYKSDDSPIGFLVRGSGDVQNNRVVFITSQPSKSVIKASNASEITCSNLFVNCIFYAVRNVIKQTWLNDRDQYAYPKDIWKHDIEFINNCLAYALFSNNIKSSDGVNHWIPFKEYEVNPCESFESHFMTDFISGKIVKDQEVKKSIASISQFIPNKPINFSEDARRVFDAGRQLWIYYHQQPSANPNASLYDIKGYFQKFNEKGRMNPSSEDEKYNELIDKLKESIRILAEKIQPKVYEYGFLVK